MTTTQPHHLQALAKANRVRSARAELKEQLADGEVSVREALMSDQDWIKSMPLEQLLLATPGLGEAKVGKVMRCLGFSQVTTVAGLPLQVRWELLGYLRCMCPDLRFGGLL